MEIFDFKFNIFGIFFLGLLLLNCYLIFEIARKKRSSASISWALNLLVLAALASGAQAFISMSDSAVSFSFWNNVRYFCLMLVPPSFLIFILGYIGKESFLKRFFSLYALFIPTIFILFALIKTDLIYVRNFEQAIQTPWGPVSARGPAELTILTPYFVFYLTLSFYLLFHSYIKNKDMAYKSEVAVLIASLLLPSVGGILFQQILPNLFKVAAFPAYVPFVAVMNIVILFLVSKPGIFVLAPKQTEMDSFRSIGSGVFLIDSNGVIKFVNQAAANITGYLPNQLSSIALPQLLANQESLKTFEEILKCKNYKDSHNHILELDIKTSDQTVVPVNILCSSLGAPHNSSGHLIIMASLQNASTTRREIEKSLMELGRKNISLADTEKAMMNILEDAMELQEALKSEKVNIEKKVTERTRDLQEKTRALTQAKDAISQGWLQLEKEKARLDASIKGLPLGFVMTDKAGQVVIANELIKNILDLQILKKIEDVSTALGGDFDLCKYHNLAIEKNKMFEFEDIVWKDKHLRIFLDPIVIEGSKENVIGVVLLVEDITEAKVLERSRDEFFSIASHELRTPLTAIRGNTSLIKDYFADKIKDSELAEMIDDIHQSSTRLIEIVNDFLDTSRLEQGKMAFNLDRVDMAEVIESVVRDLMVMAQQKKLYLKVEGEPTLPALGDREKVEVIMMNLVGNALKFTDKGGVTIKLTKDGGSAHLEVKDTGRGISLPNQNLLFRKFQQAGESLLTRDATKGTGLGLYISKLMAGKMGGDIGLLKSEEGKGSTFFLKLPLFKQTSGTQTSDAKTQANGISEQKEGAIAAA